MSKTKWITIRVDEQFYNRVNRVVDHINSSIEGKAIKKTNKANWALWALESALIKEEEELLTKTKKRLQNNARDLRLFGRGY